MTKSVKKNTILESKIKGKMLLIENSEFLSKIVLSKDLKESVKMSSGKAGTLIVKNVPCTILNRQNQNGRVYSTKVVQAAIDEARPFFASKQLLSQACEHPEGSFVSPTTASHVVINAYIKPQVKLEVDGEKGKYDVLFQDWEILNTTEGKNLRALFEAECSIGTSIRGVGDMNGQYVEDYTLLGCDCVGNPSSSTFTRMPISESVHVEFLNKPDLHENFNVTTSSTNVVRDLEKAAELQSKLDNIGYGTVSKTSTKVDQEMDPKTGAQTSLTTLEAETADEVTDLDQALLLAKRAILNGYVNVDSVSIEKIAEKTPKESTRDNMNTENKSLNEDIRYSTYFRLYNKDYDFYPFMDYYKAYKEKYDSMECEFLNTGLNFVYEGTLIGPKKVGDEIVWVADNGEEYYGIDFIDYSLEEYLKETYFPDEVEESVKESIDASEVKSKLAGHKFILKTSRGFVAMDGNTLVFVDDPKDALHFVVGKEESGLIHLSGVQKILDAMGVFDVEFYYQKHKDADKEDTSSEDEIHEAAGDTLYTARVIIDGDGVEQSIDMVPVSGKELDSITAEISNLYDLKSKNSEGNVEIDLINNTTKAEYVFSPKDKLFRLKDGEEVLSNEVNDENSEEDSLEIADTIEVEDPSEDIDSDEYVSLADINDDTIEEATDNGTISQDKNKLSIDVQGETIEKEFDTPEQASVAKAGLEAGELDGDIMIEEAPEVFKGYYVYKKDIDPTEITDFSQENKNVFGPYNTREEAEEDFVEYLDQIDIVYVDPTADVQEITEKLYEEPSPASDDFIEKDNMEDLEENDSNTTAKVTISDIDWNIDTLADVLDNGNALSAVNDVNDLADIMKNLPDTLTVEVDLSDFDGIDSATIDAVEKMKQRILDKANSEVKCKINDAKILSIS